MAQTRLTTPEKSPIEEEMEELRDKGETVLCTCGKEIHKYWHIKTGPQENKSFPEMVLCGPCYFSN